MAVGTNIFVYLGMIKILRSSILAGIAIGFAGFGFLACGRQPVYGSLAGAIIFCFGLLTVVEYKLKLFTGTAGFIKKGEIGDLLLILLGNIIGTLLVSLLSRISPLGIVEGAEKLLAARLATGALKCGALAIGCGFMMTTAVTFARQGRFLPLLFAVPLFIVCGFPHCIADAFYYLSAPWSFLGAHFWQILALYVCIVLGNALGCNLYRLIAKE